MFVCNYLVKYSTIIIKKTVFNEKGIKYNCLLRKTLYYIVLEINEWNSFLDFRMEKEDIFFLTIFTNKEIL